MTLRKVQRNRPPLRNAHHTATDAVDHRAPEVGARCRGEGGCQPSPGGATRESGKGGTRASIYVDFYLRIGRPHGARFLGGEWSLVPRHGAHPAGGITTRPTAQPEGRESNPRLPANLRNRLKNLARSARSAPRMLRVITARYPSHPHPPDPKQLLRSFASGKQCVACFDLAAAHAPASRTSSCGASQLPRALLHAPNNRLRAQRPTTARRAAPAERRVRAVLYCCVHFSG